MKLKAQFKLLVDELNELHSGASPWSEEVGMPDFVTAENGMQRHFSRRARESLAEITRTLHENRPSTSPRIEMEEYGKVVRQVVADFHAENKFSDFDESDPNDVVQELKLLIDDRVAALTVEFTHHFPVWTLGMEKLGAFPLGPVMLFSRNDWIDAVDFSERAKNAYLNLPDDNHRWKEILKEALQNPNGRSAIDGLASVIHSSIEECPAVARVTVRGYELKFSRKLARIAVKATLDAISLGFGASECFHQQALHDERLPPIRTNSVVETNGFLWLPGTSLGPRIPTQPLERVMKALSDLREVLPAFGAIIEGIVDPSTHRHPKMANRWATALDWFGEGNRESSDAIALAKLGTCLDVLCCGGYAGGITEMVTRLTGVSPTTEVVKGTKPRTLKELVEDIYNHGRSKILHGTHYDRLESFLIERKQATYLARVVLIESAVRLQTYAGPDTDKAFRTM